MGHLRRRLTYANVASTLALFLVLTGGAAVAAQKLGTKGIKPGSIKTKLLAKNAVKSPKIAPRAVKQRHLAHNAVGSNQIAPDAVGFAQIAPNSIDGSKIRNGSISAAHLPPTPSAVVATATGGPVNVTSPVPVDVPISNASWTRAPGDYNLYLARVEATLEKAPASICFVEVTVTVDGQSVGTVSLFTQSEDPETLVSERLLDGAGLASGAPETNEFGASAQQVGSFPCESAKIDSVRLVVLRLS